MPITAKRNHVKKRVSLILFTVILLGAMFFFQDVLNALLGEFSLYPYIAVVMLAILADVLDYLRYSTTSIEVSDKAVVYRTGILTKKEITYPFHKIANTRTQVTITDRIFGMKTLMIDTAGESNLDLTINDLPAKTCDAIYNEVNGKMGKIKLVKKNDEA
jgi:membrane protein YdbS with pleckstrin-like domain